MQSGQIPSGKEEVSTVEKKKSKKGSKPKREYKCYSLTPFLKDKSIVPKDEVLIITGNIKDINNFWDNQILKTFSDHGIHDYKKSIIRVKNSNLIITTRSILEKHLSLKIKAETRMIQKIDIMPEEFYHEIDGYYKDNQYFIDACFRAAISEKRHEKFAENLLTKVDGADDYVDHMKLSNKATTSLSGLLQYETKYRLSDFSNDQFKIPDNICVAFFRDDEEAKKVQGSMAKRYIYKKNGKQTKPINDHLNKGNEFNLNVLVFDVNKFEMKKVYTYINAPEPTIFTGEVKEKFQKLLDESSRTAAYSLYNTIKKTVINTEKLNRKATGKVKEKKVKEVEVEVEEDNLNWENEADIRPKRTQLIEIAGQFPEIKLPPKVSEVEFYDVNNPADIKRLEDDENEKYHPLPTERKIKYQMGRNKFPPGTFIGKVAAINQLGLFTKHLIRKGEVVWKYIGETVSPEMVNKNGYYSFGINEEMDIDAAYDRDPTADINHSYAPNFHVEIINNKVYMRAIHDIPANSQITFNYKRPYFKAASTGYKPYYLSGSDNWKSDAEVFLEKKEYYHSASFRLHSDVMENLKLGDADAVLLLPKTFISILKDDAKQLAKDLASCPHSLVAYACVNNEILPQQQQHLDALMLACYLGHEDCIITLLNAGASVDNFTFNTGNTALNFLLSGYASDGVIEKIAPKLINHMRYAHVANQENLTPTHYAISKNKSDIISLLETKYKKMYKATNVPQNLFSVMFNRDNDEPDHADFIYCLKNGYFETLDVLLQALMVTHTEAEISMLMEADQLFYLEYIQKLPEDTIKEFAKRIKAEEYEIFYKCMSPELQVFLSKVLEESNNKKRPGGPVEEPTKEKKLKVVEQTVSTSGFGMFAHTSTSSTSTKAEITPEIPPP